MTGKSLKIIIQQLFLMCYMKKKREYVQPTFQNITQTANKLKQIIILMISDGEG